MPLNQGLCSSSAYGPGIVGERVLSYYISPYHTPAYAFPRGRTTRCSRHWALMECAV